MCTYFLLWKISNIVKRIFVTNPHLDISTTSFKKDQFVALSVSLIPPAHFPIILLALNFFFSSIFFGHTTQLVGSQFPDQGLNPGKAVKAQNPNH